MALPLESFIVDHQKVCHTKDSIFSLEKSRRNHPPRKEKSTCSFFAAGAFYLVHQAGFEPATP
ncbi:MAG: hypothetical protein CSA20_05960 [Deltaproteobacteria bacterium]|nr:MAG: hypothetical protein CSA20_05960 [Deltaproteobacteria bacterium]